ncbi:MAG: hypothetical protein QM699_17715 [Amaricoccus sp.]|uniref:hypothetical protein n=1 Tax=Amaricoccus sp. TaxID=1872485 RepID=UPI0039E67D04
MPNVKIFVDETQYPALRSDLAALLPGLRDQLCGDFAVDRSACQFAVIPVLGLPDQPPVNVELNILSGPERTREVVAAAAARLRETIGAATGRHIAVRIAQLDPEGYVALK